VGSYECRKKLKVVWEQITETKEVIGGFRGKSEVTIPAELESSTTQLQKMAEYTKKPAQELRKMAPEAAFARLRKY